MIKIKFTGTYLRNLKELAKDSQELKEIIRKKTKIFLHKPADSRLKNHPLKRRLEGKWAFSVTEDIRVVYIWKGKNVVHFLAVGPHKKVYKKN